ncbi:MAG: TolC family outer membrane protein [Desulfuromonadales bacterium]
MRNSIRFILVAALFAVVPTVQAAETHDLLSLYVLAAAKDPSLGRARAHLESRQVEVRIATAYLLPRLDVNAGSNRMWTETLHYGPKTVEGAYYGYNYGASLSQPLFNLPAIINRLDIDAGVRSSDAALTAARQDLMMRLVDAYTQLLKDRVSERLLQDEVKRYEQIARQAQAFLKAGTGDIITTYEAQARLDSAKAELVRTEGMRKQSAKQLETLVGIPVGALKDLGATAAEGPQPADVNYWLEQTRKVQPQILQAREELLLASSQVSQARAEHMPTFNLSGGYSVSKGSTFLPEVETRQWYAGVNLSLPIFRGGETLARTARSKAAESERRLILQDSTEQMLLKTEQAFMNIESSVSLLRSLEQKQKSAAIQLEATKKGLSIGTRTAVDLLNAEQTHAASLRDLLSARYDHLHHQLQLKVVSGIASEDDLAALNSLLTTLPPEKI